ncbi:MAG: RDD family protein [Synergistaceae bacterium]|jgi:uncharacterized RDD family membrane protein YckC|nr:RDD family protein [Synergistaceae bacterium]
MTDRAASHIDRVSELFGGTKRKRRVIESPEGVALTVGVATRGERLYAFLIDILLMFVIIFCLYALFIPLFFSRADIPVGMTLILFLVFIVRNLYFLHFELAWQGRTPGKRICGLRVINRYGGELSPSAVIARNLTREVEFFLPVSLFLSLGDHAGAAASLAALGWVLAIAALPLFNRDNLRAGDLIGGTMVISTPRRALSGDLSLTAQDAGREAVHSFTREQLAVYGAFELQVLEELLRSPPNRDSDRVLSGACDKIRLKIGWADEIPPGEVRRFLSDFYAAERDELERGQLFGRIRADKTAAPPTQPRN